MLLAPYRFAPEGWHEPWLAMALNLDGKPIACSPHPALPQLPVEIRSNRLPLDN